MNRFVRLALSAFPNPFVRTTRVRYTLPRAGHLSAAVFDVVGRRIETLFNGVQDAGGHELVWDRRQATDGAYLIRLESGTNVRSVKVVAVTR